MSMEIIMAIMENVGAITEVEDMFAEMISVITEVKKMITEETRIIMEIMEPITITEIMEVITEVIKSYYRVYV